MIQIGSKFTGKNELFFNSQTGEYRESLPRISGDAAVIQAVIITRTPQRRSLLDFLVGTGK